jgi:hypothetical protein
MLGDMLGLRDDAGNPILIFTILTFVGYAIAGVVVVYSALSAYSIRKLSDKAINIVKLGTDELLEKAIEKECKSNSSHLLSFDTDNSDVLKITKKAMKDDLRAKFNNILDCLHSYVCKTTGINRDDVSITLIYKKLAKRKSKKWDIDELGWDMAESGYQADLEPDEFFTKKTLAGHLLHLENKYVFLHDKQDGINKGIYYIHKRDIEASEEIKARNKDSQDVYGSIYGYKIEMDNIICAMIFISSFGEKLCDHTNPNDIKTVVKNYKSEIFQQYCKLIIRELVFLKLL